MVTLEREVLMRRAKRRQIVQCKSAVMVGNVRDIVKAYVDGVPDALTLPHQSIIQQVMGPIALSYFLSDLTSDGETTHILSDVDELWSAMEDAS